MSKRITPKQKAEVIALLEAGFSKSATSRRTGLSLSSIKRIASDPTVIPGRNHVDMVARATEVLHSSLSSESAKHQLASLIVDDLSMSAALRDNLAGLLEAVGDIEVTSLKDAGAKARTLAAIATANKLNTDSLRQVIAIAAPQVEVDELPTLTITELSHDDIVAIRAKQDLEAVEVGETLDNMEDDRVA